MFEGINILKNENQEKIHHKTVVSLKTEVYRRGNSFVNAKVLRTLKRKSKGFDVLGDGISEEIEDLKYIDNLYELPDGEYELVYNNRHLYYETGEWDFDGYKLNPLTI